MTAPYGPPVVCRFNSYDRVMHPVAGIRAGEPRATGGRTGELITVRADLDRLPAGSVVVPTWIEPRGSAGLNACTRFSDKWLRAIDDPAGPGVYPLGAVDPLGDYQIEREDGYPLDRNGLGVVVVYDPRDQL